MKYFHKSFELNFIFAFEVLKFFRVVSINSVRFKLILPSIIILIIPKAVLLKARGSFELVGCLSIIKNPTKVSILSINATILASSVDGRLSLGPKGLYCS